MEDSILHIGLLEDEAIELDIAAIELAALDHPGIDLEPYVEILTAMTEHVAAEAQEAAGSEEQATLLAAVIAGHYGFVGDRATYDDPANADLIRVIDRRRGLPVSLAILYVAAARRMGWHADVLNTPGHVLARIGPDTSPVLIDCFDRGKIIGPAELSALLNTILGANAVPAPEHLTPMSNRAVLVRLLMNQAVRAETAGDGPRALTIYERMTVISPALPHGWWERARLELAQGDRAAARRSLSAMLEITRDPDLRAHISAALDALAGSAG
jgi:regulator of sirC expression with transglutaminase-like and TPR domain